MKKLERWLAAAGAFGLAVAVTACGKDSPVRPSDVANAGTSAEVASATDAKSGVTLTTPRLLTPAEGALVPFAEQPVTLVVANAVTTGSAALTYTFEVASDTGFGSIVFSKAGVTGGGTQTSLTVNKLAGDKTYYWRARASSGSFAGPSTKPRSLKIGPEVVLQAPVLSTPGANASVGTQPTLTVNNVQRTGPAGTIVYRFDVSSSPAFDAIVFSGTQQERADLGFTSLTVATPLAEGTYWWRVQGTDTTNNVTSPISTASPFTVRAFDMTQAAIFDSPVDLGFWAQTANITSVEFTGSAFLVDFDKRDGPGRWPDVPFGDGSLEYTLGMCLNISGQWDCSAPVQFWFGRDLAASGPPSEVGINWFYDPARWGPMTGHQPADGETVGLFVCAGNCRLHRDGSGSIVRERSNVAFVPWSNHGGSSFTFSLGKILLPSRR